MASSPLAPEKSALSFDQFCEAWGEETRARLSSPPHPDEVLIAALTGLLDPFLDGLSEANFHVVDASASDGLHAVYLTDEENSDGVFVPTAFLLRLVRRDDLPSEGKMVLAETGKILRRLDEGRERAPQSWDALFDWREDHPKEKRVKLVFASLQPMPARELEALVGASNMVSARLGLDCEPLNLSLETLFRGNAGVQLSLRVAAGASELAPGFVAGTAALLDLWEFLREYETLRGDLDRLYDKNVRLFQGKMRKANKAIVKTLREEPHLFGMLNNGLTFVARTVERDGDVFTLRDPSVVNGCQTTRTLFDTLNEEFKKATASPDDYRAWKDKLRAGRVVVKIVRVAPGEDDDEAQLLQKITRSTNLQTAVKDKDFVALDEDFRRWKRELAGHGIFLEILSNEATLQLARQKRRDYDGAKFSLFAKAFDLLKIYGAGWMNEPGAAWNQNAQFLPPGGRIFKTITQDGLFRGDDLRAAFALQSAAIEHKFGKTGKNVPVSRAKTRYVFMRTALELLRRTLRQNALPDDRISCTKAILALHENTASWAKFIREAVDVVDAYMNPTSGCSIAKEPGYAGDFNAFLKRENLHKSADVYPQIFAEWSVRELLIARDPSYDATRTLLKAAFAL